MIILHNISSEAKAIVQAWYPKVFKNTLYICKYCSSPCTGAYCDDCRTAKQRKEMAEIAFKESGYVYKTLQKETKNDIEIKKIDPTTSA